MSAPLSPERCVCVATPVTDPTAAEHEKWCPSRKPSSERIAEVKAGTGRPLMVGELEWLRGDASRAELHISGAAAGAFPLSDDLPGWVAELGRKLGAVVAELDRTRTALNQSEEDLTGARLSLWEEEQDSARMRLALESAKRGRRELRARVAELEAAEHTAWRAWYSGDGAGLGHYTGRDAAMDRVHHELAHEENVPVSEIQERVTWRADSPEEDVETSWECWLLDEDGDEYEPTDYVVSPIAVAAAYDPDGDESS